MLRPLAALSALAVAACAAPGPIAGSVPVSLTPAQVAEIQATVAYDLFDPGAAQFRNIRAVDVPTSSGTVRRVCGEVNGKNRLGGYVGFTMFGGVMVDGRFQRRDFFGPC